MHKHYRMIALSQHLRSYGHTEPHTKPDGVWKKLETLYSLKTLDEREDALGELGAEDVEALAKRFCDFKLPENEFGDAMFERRLEKGNGTSASPAVMSWTRASTVEDTEGKITDCKVFVRI